MKYRIALAALLAAVTGIAFAGSQDSAKQMEEQGTASYEALDANGDGVISPEEATANPNVAARFDQLDANGDSQLDKGEFARFETEQE